MAYNQKVAIRYPIEALRQGHQGTVILLVLVGTDGRPKEIQIKKSSGYRELDRAAREGVMQYRFSAAVRDGKPFEAWVEVPINFTPQEF